jgi:hypothetical protein
VPHINVICKYDNYLLSIINCENLTENLKPMNTQFRRGRDSTDSRRDGSVYILVAGWGEQSVALEDVPIYV